MSAPEGTSPADDAPPAHEPVAATDRRQIAKIAAQTRWANTTDRSAATQAARDGMYRKFEDQVDPERRLPAAERAIRVESARRAHYQRLALRSAQSRRAKQKGGGGRAKSVDGDGI
ncbi:hypothetical protein ABKW28_11730 [Nocardioides sp. 31GB23]|uniref:hypothetical protein n=1 Tax=Nocardioides sp. 31GB23 TaxID=3156065 RepID=UPI0032AFE095